MENNISKISSRTKNILFIYILGMITVLAFYMRFPYLAISPLGDDEGFTVFYSARSLIPWNEFLWGAVEKNGFPPLDFILNHFVFLFFGVSQETARYLPTIFDTLTALILGLLGLQCCNRKTGLIAALLWALSPCAIYYATESRYYAHFAFSVVLYLLSISLYINKSSFKRLVFISACIIYGFNVSLLFSFVVIPATLSVLIYYVFIISQDKGPKFKEDIVNFAFFILSHLFSAFCVFGIYYFLKILSKSSYYYPTPKEMYSLMELLDKFLSRIYQAIYIPSAAISITNHKNDLFLLFIPLTLFLISLFQGKKCVFIKILILSFAFFVPIYDIITLYCGNKFSGWTQIRHIYFIVPIVFLFLAYSYNLIFEFVNQLLNLTFINFRNINFLITIFFVSSLIILFDFYEQSELRHKSQTNIKSFLDRVYSWLDKRSAKGETLVIVNSNRALDCSLFSYLTLFDYIHSSNIYCRIPLTIYSEEDSIKHKNELNHQIDHIDDATLDKIINNKMSLNFICYNFDKHYFDELIFDKKKIDNRRMVYTLRSIPKKMTIEQFLAYSNYFGNVFIKGWVGTINKINSKLISRNPSFKNNIDGWDYWRINKFVDSNTVTFAEYSNNFSCVNIQSKPGKLIGLFQNITLKYGSVYRISGRARAMGGKDTMFGAQVVLGNLESKKEKWLTFLHKSDDWQYKDLIFTNDYSGLSYLILRTGYIPDFDGKALFTDVKIEELLFEDFKINNNDQNLNEDFKNE